jgi:hypothetical protein
MNEELARINASLCPSMMMMLGIWAASHVMLFVAKNSEQIFDFFGSIKLRRIPTTGHRKKKKTTPAEYGAFYIPSDEELASPSLGDDGELIYDDAITNS